MNLQRDRWQCDFAFSPSNLLSFFYSSLLCYQVFDNNGELIHCVNVMMSVLLCDKTGFDQMCTYHYL